MLQQISKGQILLTMLTNKIGSLWTYQFKLQGRNFWILKAIQNLVAHDCCFKDFLFIHLFKEAITEEMMIPFSNRRSMLVGALTYQKFQVQCFLRLRAVRSPQFPTLKKVSTLDTFDTTYLPGQSGKRHWKLLLNYSGYTQR